MKNLSPLVFNSGQFGNNNNSLRQIFSDSRIGKLQLTNNPAEINTGEWTAQWSFTSTSCSNDAPTGSGGCGIWTQMSSVWDSGMPSKAQQNPG